MRACVTCTTCVQFAAGVTRAELVFAVLYPPSTMSNLQQLMLPRSISNVIKIKADGHLRVRKQREAYQVRMTDS
jgi:hypothetical protein